MANSIFKFWSCLELGQKVHPADEDVLRCVDHSLNLRCLPSPFGGKLKTAPVVLLFLNPGLSEPDLRNARLATGRKRAFKNLSGRSDFPTEKDHPNAAKWLKSRAKFLGDWKTIRRNLAVLELCPYHSKSFKDHALLAALPSVRAMVEWAQTELFPQAIEGNRAVICMRAPKFWGLSAGTKRGLLFAPETNRAGYAHKDCRIGKAAVRAVQRLVQDNRIA